MPSSAPSTTFKSLLTKDKDSGGKGWSKEVAYEHSLVTGNDGRVINRLPHIPNAQDAVHFICMTNLHSGLANNKSSIARCWFTRMAA
ncbi:MAG: hypothetical protein IPG06_02850 [Haliea sp.]|nr:hypothetical protein [Haliea sp.]